MKTLRKGLKLLTEVGWCRGRGKKYEGRKIVAYCAFGALNFSWPARRVVEQAAGIDSLVPWNDRRDRKKTQVIAAFKKAIAYRQKQLEAAE